MESMMTRRYLLSFLSLTLFLSQISLIPRAHAATITATGANASICDQTVGTSTNVIAYRLSGGDCVIEFKNTGTTTWTPNADVSTVRVLVVGGGGGGASRHAGGGGAGGVVEAIGYAVTGTVGIQVGAGGAGGASTSDGSAGGSSRIFSNSEATTGSTGITALGGGCGGFYTKVGNTIVRPCAGGSGGGSGVPNPFTRDLTAGYTNADPRGLSTQSTQVQKTISGSNLSSNFTQYGNDGAAGGNQDYWAGGGGGGAGAVGSRGGGVAGTGYYGGAGGVGVAIDIRGTADYFAGGGGGGGGLPYISGAYVAQPGGAGGNGGGGAGSQGAATATAGIANTGGGGGGGGYTAATSATGGAGGSGIVIVRYTPLPIISGPSSSISIAENTTSIHTFSANVSVTWSKSGTDAAFFSITSGGVLTISSRDYEAPQDSGSNNTYLVTITGTDSYSNATSQSLTVTITNANELGSVTAPTTSGTIYKGVSTTISVTLNVPGQVRFFVGSKRIANCLAKPTVGSYPSLTATCSWKPAVTGMQRLTATLTPTDSSFSASTSSATEAWVVKRGTAR